MSKELHWRSLVDLAGGLASGELTPLDLTRHALERIETLDPDLRSFCRLEPEPALAAAERATTARRRGEVRSDLHGVPYAAKDLFDVAGLPTTAGSRLLASNIAARHSTVVERLEAAGLILLGKTCTVQLAYGGAGINHDQGTPHNPWHREPHLPGGSSSGSGVAVAAGMVAAALGTDTGGSVRIPAALCGITGLKTTVGRVSRAGVYPLSWSLDSVGPLARSAEDAALLYRLLEGPDGGDPTTWGRPAGDPLDDLDRRLTGRRLAIAETGAFWDGVDPEVERAVRAAAEVFAELGAEVSPIDFAEAAHALELNRRGQVIAAEAYALNRKLMEEHADELDPIVASRVALGRDVSVEEYLGTVRAWQDLRVKARAALEPWDALLCPTCPIPARPVAVVDADLETYLAHNLRYLRNTSIGNVLNLCSVSVPCGFATGGLPIGLMIYGKPFAERVVLNVAHAYQQATDWHFRHPDLGWIEPVGDN